MIRAAAASASVEINVATMSDGLEQFASTVEKCNIADEIRKPLRIEIGTLRQQLRKTPPNQKMLLNGLRSLRRIVERAPSQDLITALTALYLAASDLPRV